MDSKPSGQQQCSERLDSLIKDYLRYERIEQHKQFVENLIRQNDTKQLERLIGTRLTFGTAGLRAAMGPGFNQMNDLVIIQTSQGLASYLLEVDSAAVRQQGVVIGHDARHNSDRFARLVVLAFLQRGIPVFFCDHIIATPLIAFGVRHYGCSAGIMVTASHNPKQDNGYKVYWSNGAQILSPHDANIQRHITQPSNLEPWPAAWSQELVRPGAAVPSEWANLLVRCHGDLSKSYFAYIEALVGEARTRNRAASICITYTTMHGVGHMFLSRALDIAGFEDVFPVELQKKPDPEFSTVKFPNPEEAGALDLAFETAKHANSNLILANDPDADRCAAALYEPQSGYRRVFSGNEIGALLGWWMWHSQQESGREASDSIETMASESPRTPTPRAISADVSADSRTIQASDCYMISTAVSSKFLQSMARVEGFNFIETLTGFKYMGNLADELISKHQKKVVFAYEEAIGYMVDSTILDKDGISAAVQLAQCAAYVSISYSRSLEQQLDWLYTIYGYHYSLNSYYLCRDQSTIRDIFTNLQANYPTNFGQEFQVTRVRDLNKAYDSATRDQRPTLPCSSSSFMVTFFVADEITFTVRTSGTEPKIKYYSEIVAALPPLSHDQPVDGADQLAAKGRAREKLGRFVRAALEVCLKPDEHNLEPAE